MRKLLPAVVSGVMAVSFSQLAAAQGVGVQGNVDADVKTRPAEVQSNTGATVQGDTGSSSAGQTSDPNVTRDAQGREHTNKGKHTGQRKHDKEKQGAYSDREGSGAGATGERRDDHEGRANKRGDKQGEEAQSNTNKPKY